MAHCNDESSERQKKGAQVTPRWRSRLVSGGVSVGGLALSVSLLSGVVEPDVATALAAVVGSAVTSVVLLSRSSSPAPAGSDRSDGVSLEK
ncbi:hypothetical protein ABT147_37440 [Streptomyces sp. NPDC001868]|uniref:hypothetical protein n=1 Tax=Streptomyces sp. NPDC001868 TaxID=3154401 RepID=UPI003326B298